MKKGSDNHEGARDLVVFGQFCLLARTPTVPKPCILLISQRKRFHDLCVNCSGGRPSGKAVLKALITS